MYNLISLVNFSILGWHPSEINYMPLCRRWPKVKQSYDRDHRLPVYLGHQFSHKCHRLPCKRFTKISTYGYHSNTEKFTEHEYIWTSTEL